MTSPPSRPPSSQSSALPDPAQRRNRRFVWLGWAVFLIAAVYGMIYWDVVCRAKECYRKGELYADWAAHPDKKKSYFAQEYERALLRLESEREKDQLTEGDFNRRREALAFDRDEAIRESSLKYAYQWYKDTYELFSPPESRWVRLARQKAPDALARWKEELRAQKIRFDDHMVE